MKDKDKNKDKTTDKWFSDKILNRFLKYVKIDTTSDRHSSARPTTTGQWKLAKLLAQELKEIGISDVTLDENCFVIACLDSNLLSEKRPTESSGMPFKTERPAAKSKSAGRRSFPAPPVIGFIAHIDTSEDVSGKDVKPLIHSPYDGRPIQLEDEYVLNPKDSPLLNKYTGETIITSNGRTLLGADDKAGIAEIVTAMEYLINHPEIPHGRLEVIFTPDEETGFGMKEFPLTKIQSQFCYTIDGEDDGTIEAECFYAYKVDVFVKGKCIHLGKARGKLINAVEIAASFLNMLPKTESPQATDGRYGYYCALEIKGDLEKAYIEILLRDFEEAGCLRRIKAIKSMAASLEIIYPGCNVTIKAVKQYANMKTFLDKYPEVIQKLKQAIRETGVEPEHKIIRGGTDGARLSEMGIPTPNVFSGSYNCHSRVEWAALPVMVRASKTCVNLARIWAEKYL